DDGDERKPFMHLDGVGVAAVAYLHDRLFEHLVGEPGGIEDKRDRVYARRHMFEADVVFDEHVEQSAAEAYLGVHHLLLDEYPHEILLARDARDDIPAALVSAALEILVAHDHRALSRRIERVADV